MKQRSVWTKRIFIFALLLLAAGVSCPGALAAELFLNIFAMNGTDETKEKDIQEYLPGELKEEDVLDTSGLELKYDVNENTYYVQGKIKLGPKENRTIKVKIRDVWLFGDKEIADIKQQIDLSLERLKGGEYYENATIKKQSLLQRLDYITRQQAEYADNIQKRIDNYRTYADEIAQIRRDSVSVKFWRAKPPPVTDANTYRLIVQLENPSAEETRKILKKLYLPAEVKPEHLLSTEGFDINYDPSRGQSYLSKEEQLQPKEVKRYQVPIVDMWKIPSTDIDNVKERGRKVFKLLEKTEYLDSAQYLVNSIKEKLQKIEAAQAQGQDIYQHISFFRSNQKLLASALEDVKSLEELLEAVRETLERSQLKNILQRIQSFKNVARLAEAIFKTRPALNNAWKIIIGIVIFVGIFTTIHFAIWGRRSRETKKTQIEENQTKDQKK